MSIHGLGNIWDSNPCHSPSSDRTSLCAFNPIFAVSRGFEPPIYVATVFVVTRTPPLRLTNIRLFLKRYMVSLHSLYNLRILLRRDIIRSVLIRVANPVFSRQISFVVRTGIEPVAQGFSVLCSTY
jgi:hypothetical protein